MSEFTRSVHVRPAFDKRNADPSKDYGIGACRIHFILKGPKGAICFTAGTDWYVPTAREHLTKFPLTRMDLQRAPQCCEVGYHSLTPMYEGQHKYDGCTILGEPCYHDGSYVQGEEWAVDFVAGGTEWLWGRMEKQYRATFEDREVNP